MFYSFSFFVFIYNNTWFSSNYIFGTYSDDIQSYSLVNLKDIFPIEFENAIENLALNDTSNIIELDDTFHILKITEINIQESPPEDQVKEQLKNELIQTESFALMQDDFNDLEDMIFNNASLAEIATDLSKNIEVSDYYSVNDFNFSNPSK